MHEWAMTYPFLTFTLAMIAMLVLDNIVNNICIIFTKHETIIYEAPTNTEEKQ